MADDNEVFSVQECLDDVAWEPAALHRITGVWLSTGEAHTFDPPIEISIGDNVGEKIAERLRVSSDSR